MGLRSVTATLLIAGILVLTDPGRAPAEALDGRFYGVDQATGATIEIAPDDQGYRGTFFDRTGNSQSFQADRRGDTAEAVLDMDGRTVLMEIAPMPFGAQVRLIPFDEQGNLTPTAGRLLGFVREGLSMPAPSEHYIHPPANDRGRISAHGFLNSYEFWPPVGVRNGYMSLPERFRTLIRLFPAVQLDVIWKLCLAPGADPALAIALRGQGVACPEVVESIAQIQRDGRFERFKDEVAREKAVVLMNVRCADGFIESKTECDRAARALSAQAVKLETAGAVLGRYR